MTDHASSKSATRLAVAFAICFVSIMFSGISSMLMSVYLPVAVKDLLGSVTDEKMNSVSAYISSIFIFGTMTGGFTWGIICDKYGRARSVTLATACYGLFTLFTAFTSSWVMVGVFRFLTGFGVGGVLVTTNILISEVWPERKRAVAVGLVSAAMPVGFIIAGALNNILPDWHRAFLSGVVPVVAAIIASLSLREIEDWKKSRATGNHNLLAANIFNEGSRGNLWYGSLVFGAMLIGLWAVFSWAPTWVQSITDAAKAQDQRGFTMMVLSVAGLCGSVASGWIVNALGVRRTMIMCFAGCFILTGVIFKLNTSVSPATFAEMAILAIFFGISQGTLSVYIPQLFPIAIRASATGFCFNIGRLFTATVVFFIGALVTLLGGYGNAVFVFSFIFVAGLAVTLFSRHDPAREEALKAAVAERE